MNINKVTQYPVNMHMVNIKLSQAYVPYQEYRNLLPIEQALYKGTAFQELYQPYYNKYKK